MALSSHPRWRARHQSVLEFVLANPLARREAVASATGYSPWQVSRIMNSPDFRCRLMQAFDLRMAEIARLHVWRWENTRRRAAGGQV